MIETIANLFVSAAQNGAAVASRWGWYEPKVPKKLLEKQK